MKNWHFTFCILLVFLSACKSDNPLQDEDNTPNPVIQNIAGTVSIDSLMHYVRQISGDIPIVLDGKVDTIRNRELGTAKHEAAKLFLAEKLKNYGFNVQLQSFDTGIGQGCNILGVQKGVKYPGKKYIVCAHYDSYSKSSPGYAPGADDNGSGVAAVIEAARILSKYKLNYTVIYALWDMEESGLAGSRYFAKKSAEENDTLIGVINMDVIAFDGDNDKKCLVQGGSDNYSRSMVDKVININKIYNIGLDPYNIANQGMNSDHNSFIRLGFSAMIISEFGFSDKGYYHTEKDIIKYISPDYFLGCSKLGICSIAYYAEVGYP